MKFNENIVKGKWLEIKGDIQKAWGKLTDDELEKTKGDMKAISGLIQQKYGEAEVNADKKVSEIISRFETSKDKTVENLKAKVKNEQ
jgi:uncharacterized protein YjbJ (UPF0337 family)